VALPSLASNTTSPCAWLVGKRWTEEADSVPRGAKLRNSKEKLVSTGRGQLYQPWEAKDSLSPRNETPISSPCS
jgi:hypothetical protein